MMILRALTLSVLATPAMADIRVATDVLPVHSMVARVMEGAGSPDLIVPANASPHGHAMRPSEAAAVEAAQVIVWIGPDLTPWLADSLDALAPFSTRIGLMDVPGTSLHLYAEGEEHDHGDHGEDHDDHDHDKEHGHDDDHAHDEHAHDDHDHDEHAHDEHDHDEHGDEEHAHGEDHAHDDHKDHDDHAHGGHDHDHGEGDPHGWLNPDNAALWMPAIARVLGTVDPENAALYEANAAAGVAEVEAAAAEARAMLEAVADKPFLVFHDAYGHFVDEFGVSLAGAIRLGDASEPGAARVVALQQQVREEGIVCVFSEPQLPGGVVNTVAENTDVRIAELDPLGTNLTAGPQLYPNLIKALATDLSTCLAD